MARQKIKQQRWNYVFLLKLKKLLEDGKPVRSIDFNEDDQKWVNQAQLLTSKNVIYR